MGAKELLRRSHQTFIFKLFFAHFVLQDRLDGLSKRALHFQNMQYRIGFINVLDALIESMLDHRTVTPKSKNERHAAWERSGAKKNERHAAWERSGKKMVAQKGSPKNAPNHLKQTVSEVFSARVTPNSRRAI